MAPIDLVTPAWLAEHLADPDLVVLDGSYYLPTHGRDAEAEYRVAHIPGALRFDIDVVKDRGSPLPHMLPSPEDFAAAAGALGIGNDSQVVAYDGMGLFAAPRVAWMFALYGAQRVAVLDGGLPAWLAEGRSVEGGDGAPRSARTFTPRFDQAAVASLDDVRQALAEGSVQVVDTRSPSRFTGEEPEPRPGTRSGHMPGATNLHYADMLREGRLADPAAIEEALGRAGLDRDRPVVASCGSGVTAVVLALAMQRAGWPMPRIYDGSWSEWGSRGDTKVVSGG